MFKHHTKSNKIGVAIIIDNNVVHTNEDIKSIINNFEEFNVWIREQSSYKEDYRFCDNIPSQSLQCPYEEKNKDTCNRIYDLINKIPFDLTRGCVGACCGAHWDENGWGKLLYNNSFVFN